MTWSRVGCCGSSLSSLIHLQHSFTYFSVPLILSLLLKKTWRQCCLVTGSVTCKASLTTVEIPYHLPSYELVGWVD